MSIARIILLASLVLVAYFVLFAPSKYKLIGKHAKRVAYAYVAAILISAVLRYFGWGI
ncbi:MAG: hypothetical protein MKZ81_03945 [Dehalococcoidia bacterium]|nr:hypothetical protein [Dehalococcoidia bacterium]